MRTLTLKLPEALEAKLDALAKQRGVSKSSLVRDALSSYLAASNVESKDSFLTLAKDSARCVDGPRDLSINKKHLEGYGQ